MMRDLPATFELKRWLAERQPKFWMSDRCQGVRDATIYMFNGDQLDAIDDEIFSLEFLDAMRLPERRCIFEVRNNPDKERVSIPGVGYTFQTHSVLYCWEDGDDIHGLLFGRARKRLWSTPYVHVRLERATYNWHYTGTPESNSGAAAWTHDMLQNTGMGASGIMARGCLALSRVAPSSDKLPATKRHHLARKGVGGFEYKIVDIPDPPKPKSPHQGGTHASPRWHKRRGHWRTLKSGARVYVRECEIGKLEQGAVIKDYRVLPA